jgi:hypothetical protein
MWLLITGVPGTGKTTIGDYLANAHGFEHLDFEHRPTLTRFFGRGETGLRAELDALRERGDVVITWGFDPDAQLAAVLFLRDFGFSWIWFDGDRAAARREFLRRDTVHETARAVQLEKIDRHIDLSALRPRLINTFDGEGAFRSLAEISSELLADDDEPPSRDPR